MQIEFDIVPGHTGSIGHRLPDGTLSAAGDQPGTAAAEAAEGQPGAAGTKQQPDTAVAYRAMCSCGWTGKTDFPPSQFGTWSATSQWIEHMQPLWAAAPPDWLLGRSDSLRQNLTELANDWPLQALGVLAAIERWQKPLIEQAVVLARDAGTSWAEIGAALGITKQSAHQRFANAARRPADRDTDLSGTPL